MLLDGFRLHIDNLIHIVTCQGILTNPIFKGRLVCDLYIIKKKKKKHCLLVLNNVFVFHKLTKS